MSDATTAQRVAGPPRYQLYPAYNGSGVEQLEQIPARWEVNRLNFVAHIEAGAIRGIEADIVRLLGEATGGR